MPTKKPTRKPVARKKPPVSPETPTDETKPQDGTIAASERPAEDIALQYLLPLSNGLGVEIRENIPVDEIVTLVRHLDTRQEYCAFAIGDILKHAERTHESGTYEAILLSTGRSVKTLQNYKSISAAIAPEERRPELTHSVHAVVVSMKASDQRNYLAIAAKDGLTVKELKAKIKADKPPKGTEHQNQPTTIVSTVTEQIEEQNVHPMDAALAHIDQAKEMIVGRKVHRQASDDQLTKFLNLMLPLIAIYETVKEDRENVKAGAY